MSAAFYTLNKLSISTQLDVYSYRLAQPSPGKPRSE